MDALDIAERKNRKKNKDKNKKNAKKHQESPPKEDNVAEDEEEEVSVDIEDEKEDKGRFTFKVVAGWSAKELATCNAKAAYEYKVRNHER